MLTLPGASTRDIIRQYVATIRALLEVDPGGGLLEAIGPPVRAYLRGRHDAVRCVVAALTGDDGDASGADSLLEELAQPPVPEVRAPVLKLSGYIVEPQTEIQTWYLYMVVNCAGWLQRCRITAICQVYQKLLPSPVTGRHSRYRQLVQ